MKEENEKNSTQSGNIWWFDASNNRRTNCITYRQKPPTNCLTTKYCIGVKKSRKTRELTKSTHPISPQALFDCTVLLYNWNHRGTSYLYIIWYTVCYIYTSYTLYHMLYSISYNKHWMLFFYDWNQIWCRLLPIRLDSRYWVWRNWKLHVTDKTLNQVRIHLFIRQAPKSTFFTKSWWNFAAVKTNNLSPSSACFSSDICSTSRFDFCRQFKIAGYTCRAKYFSNHSSYG